MLVKSTAGTSVSFTGENGKSLFDSTGTEWFRDASKDDLERKRIGYTNISDPSISVQLTVSEMVRVCQGTHAMNTPTTVEEMREYSACLHKALRPIIDQWPDQQLREILIKAEDAHRHPGLMMEQIALAQAEREAPPEAPPEIPTEATGRPSGARGAQGTAKRTPRPRKQEGSVSVVIGEGSVLLTPKQLEFMERLSECPGWDKSGISGEYVASEYAAELSDSMNSMSVGAVVTTLREKHLLHTEKRRIGAIKCCVFRLTDFGVEVYNKLTSTYAGTDK